MISVFPTPFPDEILYSVIARYSDMMRFSDLKEVHSQLFGSRCLRAVVDLPSHLEALTSHLPNGHSHTVMQLIQEHTLFPYYAPFLPKERVWRLIDLMRGDGGQAVHMTSGISTYSVPRPPHLKYCPVCVQEDNKVLGSPYWHRVHQLPGVEVCPRHYVFLCESTIRTSNRKDVHGFYCLPDNYNSPAISVDIGLREHLILIQIAKDSQWLLQNHVESEGIEALYHKLRVILNNRGWITTRGKKVFIKEFRSAFWGHYKLEMLKKINCEPGDSIISDWVVRLVRKPRTSQHPLHYILVLDFLGQRVTDFFNFKDEWSPKSVCLTTQGPWPCLNKASDHFDQPLICSQEKHILKKNYIDVLRCPHCGFTYKATDTMSKVKVIEYGPVWKDKLAYLISDPNVGLRQAARELGVDPATVKRYMHLLGLKRSGWTVSKIAKIDKLEQSELLFIKKRNQLRIVWEEATQLYPNEGRTALRKRVPAVYIWLRRHDMKWLEEHRPPLQKPKRNTLRVDWQERDLHLRNTAEHIIYALKDKDGKPTRFTVTSVAREMGVLALLQHYHDKLPITLEYLRSVAETREEFAVRRIGWVVRQCCNQQTILPMWKIAREAGIRKDLLFKLQPVVEEAYNNIRLYVMDCSHKI